MPLNDQDKRQLYQDLIDVTCGQYEPGDLSTPQQSEAILILRSRLAQYNKKTKEEFGPLQPAFILSQISKVPIEVVQAIADDYGLILPSNIVLEEPEDDDIPDYTDDIVFEPDMEGFENIEKLAEDDFFGGDGANSAIDFIEKVLAMMKSGQIHAISVAAVNNDGQASLWVPDNIKEEQIQKLFSPVIDALSIGPYKKPN